MENQTNSKIEEWSKGLTDGYITKLLKQQGMPVTPETIKIKRDIVMFKRSKKSIKKIINK